MAEFIAKTPKSIINKKKYIDSWFWRRLVAEEILADAYRQQMLGADWQDLFWAGQNVQNLKESIVEVAARNDLDSI